MNIVNVILTWFLACHPGAYQLYFERVFVSSLFDFPMTTIQSQVLSLKGSAKLVTEFFGYAVQAILYSRALYPDTSFIQEQQYGLSLMITTEESVKSFIDSILKQLHQWLLQRKANKLILAVKDVETDEVIETWKFDVENASEREEEEVDIGKIRKGIQNLMRQIISSVAFLPVPDGDVRRSFDLLVYTDKDAETPPLWCETGPQLVAHKNREEVRLPGFSTGIHKVDAAVAYKVELS